MFVAKVREAPKVAEAYAIADHSKNECGSVEPPRTIWVLFLIFEDTVESSFE